jgi:hypothetical protein
MLFVLTLCLKLILLHCSELFARLSLTKNTPYGGKSVEPAIPEKSENSLSTAQLTRLTGQASKPATPHHSLMPNGGVLFFTFFLAHF